MTIVVVITSEKVFIVTGDRNWLDLPINLAVVPDDFLFFDVYLFLIPFLILLKQIILVAGLYYPENETG